jgi:hypothetical protein
VFKRSFKSTERFYGWTRAASDCGVCGLGLAAKEMIATPICASKRFEPVDMNGKITLC